MKKTILLILSVLFILTGCRNANNSKNENISENTFKSFNGFLEYEMPKNWQDKGDYQGNSEICIEKADKSASVIVDYVGYDFSTPEEFINYQDENLKLEFDFIEDKNFEENNKKINSKIYETENEVGKFKVIAGTAELNGNSDAFISFMGTSITNNENEVNEIYNLVSSIKLTDVNLNEERTIVAEKEYIEITLPPKWKRFDRNLETSFFRAEGEEFLYTYANTLTREEADPQEELDKMYEQFKMNFSNAKIYSETNVEDLEDRIITSIVCGFEEEGAEGMFVYIAAIEFKNSDLFVLNSYDIIADGTFEDVKEEVEKITKSIKIKDGGEEQFKKDMENKQNSEIENEEDNHEHYEGDGHDHEHYEGDGHDH